MKETKKVLLELITNFKMIHRLALHDLVVRNKSNFLGVLWLWANPAFQIAIYAFVFGYGIRNNTPVDGVPFFYWLVPGFIMWMYISSVVTKASRSIISKIGMVTKMRFPITIVPVSTVISELYVHVLMLVTIAIILIGTGMYPTKYWLYIPYFTFSGTCFLIAFSIFNSAITTVVRDYQHIVYNAMRAVFFFTPIIFQLDTMSSGFKKLVLLNPFSYLIEGYRDAFVFQRRTVFLSYQWGIYFWAITILLFIVGAILMQKMRRNLLDYS